MVLPIRISLSAACDEVAWPNSSAMAASAAEDAAATRFCARQCMVVIPLIMPFVSIERRLSAALAGVALLPASQARPLARTRCEPSPDRPARRPRAGLQAPWDRTSLPG